MKRKLVALSAIMVGFFALTGCGSVPVNIYNAPKSNQASSEISGKPLIISYFMDTQYNTPIYAIYEKGNSIPIATHVRRYSNVPMMHELFKTSGGQIYFYGTIGDKAVFTFSNGLSSGSPLAVYDHSERKTYFLTDGNEEYMFFQRGSSYVVKLLKQNKYISLNNLREVKINEAQYSVVKLKLVTTGSQDYRTWERDVMTTSIDGAFYGYVYKVKELPPLMFGPKIERTYTDWRI